MMKSFLFVLFFLLAIAVASPLDGQARDLTPSKRFALPNLPRQPESFKALNKRTPALGPSPLYVAREASPSKRLAARQASPSKGLSARQSVASPRYLHARAAEPAPSKRFAEDSAAPQKRSLDEQHVMEDVTDVQRGFCLDGLVACPVLSTPGQFPRTFVEWEAVGFECVDFTVDLRSCGGCSSLDPIEHDCAKIPYVQGVACVAGECQISSCQPGYLLQSDGQSCSPTE
ncbi:uncharacterized protein EDB91DRAFT_1109449 [Suillus paluster]|uniref:uncharacterized protein n=1 Tax=Suillus paluster TaxID=48578 RepID=UPI001B886993|nr:uncharacterized protein EDB91DRAFT_1109449 [Suillus paluster]KAG1749746.1 hypothetical protein EDB91DRAFT_1109449 [Suillus paluster]